jgi:DNA repair protein RadA/Sms
VLVVYRQIRETAAEFQRYAKETNTPVFLIGHITKDGAIAGPKILEHMVDTVLQFEGDRHYAYRILRTLKESIWQYMQSWEFMK